MIRWTDELVINESKKFKTRAEFARKSNSAYKYSKRHNLIDEFYWLSKFVDDRPRCVYAYVDEDNKVAYIGLTVNKQLRHLTHSTGKFSTHKESKSPVFGVMMEVQKEEIKDILNIESTDVEEFLMKTPAMMVQSNTQTNQMIARWKLSMLLDGS